MCACPSRVRPARTRARLAVRQLPLSARPPTSASSSCRAPSRTSPNQSVLGDLGRSWRSRSSAYCASRALKWSLSSHTCDEIFWRKSDRTAPISPFSLSLLGVLDSLCVFSVAFPWVLWFIFLNKAVNKLPLFLAIKDRTATHLVSFYHSTPLSLCARCAVRRESTTSATRAVGVARKASMDRKRRSNESG